MKKLALLLAVVFIAVSTFGQTTTTAAKTTTKGLLQYQHSVRPPQQLPKQQQKALRQKLSLELRLIQLKQQQTPLRQKLVLKRTELLTRDLKETKLL